MTGTADPSGLTYDWNETQTHGGTRAVEIEDETLRDGLQGASVVEPTLPEKLELLEFTSSLGIRRANIGLPMSAQVDDIQGILREIDSQRLTIQPTVAVRALESDLRIVADLQDLYGVSILAGSFIGGSMLRRSVEGWSSSRVRKQLEAAFDFAQRAGVRVMFVTEDTTRTDPDDLEALYEIALERDVEQIAIADTAGTSTPAGAERVVRFVRNWLCRVGRPDVTLNWHGHNDRGLALAAALGAVRGGVDVVHATIAGVGERAGNTALDQLIVNLELSGLWNRDVGALGQYLRTAAGYLGVEIPPNYPVFGESAFRTVTGVHAAAISKALRAGNEAAADAVYSGVEASRYHESQRVAVGRLSGRSNVIQWLHEREIAPRPELVEEILAVARRSRRALRDSEIELLVDVFGSSAPQPNPADCQPWPKHW